MSDAVDGERRTKIVVLAFSVVIIVAMLSVRACMRAREGEPVDHAEAPASTAASPGKSCAVTTKPGGATVYALKGDGRVALGITPLDVEQGDYEIRLELPGYAPATLTVGVHEGPCERSLELVPEG